MITVSAKLGNGILAGVTFSPDGLVDEIQFMIGCDDAISQIAHTIYKNKGNKSVVFSTLGENINVANTFSIIFQASNSSDIVTQDGGYFVLKDVTVEWIP